MKTEKAAQTRLDFQTYLKRVEKLVGVDLSALEIPAGRLNDLWGDYKSPEAAAKDIVARYVDISTVAYSAVIAQWLKTTSGQELPTNAQLVQLKAQNWRQAEREVETLPLPDGYKLWAVGLTEDVKRNCKLV